VAVNPGAQLCRDLNTRLDAHRENHLVAWTRPATWHLTLMFLGDWPAERTGILPASLQERVASHRPFAVQPGGVAAFPDRRRPRVLFLQMDGGEALLELASEVRRAVNEVWPDGPQDRKDFRPHLTLARIKQPLPEPAATALTALDLGAWKPFAVDRALLMSSELHAQGARYTVQAELPLLG